MRILFSGVPAFGHLLPQLPLARAARQGGHDVAVLTAAVMDGPLGLLVLGAGPTGLEVVEELAQRTGRNMLEVLVPEPEDVAELFAGARVDLTIEEAMDAARAWKPDLIVAEAYDFVGPLVAAGLGVPWSVLTLGPALPDEQAALFSATVAPRYEQRGLIPTLPLAFIDRCPPSLQIPGWVAPGNRIALRPEPHREEGYSGDVPRFSGGEDRPLVLVTLGTVFNDPGLLEAIVTSLEPAGVNVIATLGPDGSPDATTVERDWVRLVDFAPLDSLLEDVNVVVTAGGSGTVLGTLSRGIPMVLAPQGADQAVNGTRVAEVGAGITVEKPDQIGEAVARLLADRSFSDRAGLLAQEIADMRSPAEVVRQLVARMPA
ncbi:glycosyltransferase [Streptomyces sp. NPDC050287]|uniref:glycosyltransferase n=1 Tax=Streptomyces sp. NPDC050287 TaxID=3365608 RepID=UPI0037B0D6F8